jgi:DNA-binding NtrC family response regulator
MTDRILLIENDAKTRKLIADALSTGHSVHAASEGTAALDEIGRGRHAIVLIGTPSDMDGLDLLRKGVKARPESVFLMVSNEADLERVVEAVRDGAYGYVPRPVKKDALVSAVERAAEEAKKRGAAGMTGAPKAAARPQASKKYSFDNIVGRSGAILGLFELVRKVADSDSNVLVLGESGTGKELIARTIHHNSPRGTAPFMPVNCGAIPSELLESELFGHEKGAFTGAVASRPGRFERADTGTIFLDEIGELAFPLQVKLLRVLQEREFERVGGNKTIGVDVRVIAATNRDLEEAVREKNFREDLYYRLNVIPIHVPPLRERKEDIPLLARHFLSIMAAKKARSVEGFTDDAMDVFKKYPWPGNIRELENIMERIVILKHDDGKVGVDDIPDRVRSGASDSRAGCGVSAELPDGGVDLVKILDDIEADLINKALEKAGGVKSRAAELLKINRTTLIEKMRKKGMLVSEAKVKSAGE